MLSIKVLGPGCDNCKKVETIAKQAVASLGVEAQFEKVTDRAEYPKYGLLYTPGYTIMGGTSNVMRNILGERVLGLPRS